MPCKVNLIYNCGPSGWTETFYRLASSIENAADFRPEFFRAAMQMRARRVTLEATRSQEIFSVRRMYLDLAQITGTIDSAPDVASSSAYCWIHFKGGYGRPLYIRGLPDELIRRTARGKPNPPAQLLDMIGEYTDQIQAEDLRGRLRRRSVPWHHVRRLSPSADEPANILLELDDDWAPPPGTYVYFGDVPSLLTQPGRAYWVQTSTPGFVTLYQPWPVGLIDQLPFGLKVKALEYDFPELESIEFRYYTSHRTGRAYLPMTWEADNPRAVPLSPCQRIVDYVRLPYRVGMRFATYDIGVIDNVRWFSPLRHLRDDAPGVPLGDGPRLTTIPYAHPFGSRNWELEEWPELPIGETGPRVQVKNYQRGILSGRGLGGSADVWSDGDNGASPPLLYSPLTGWP